MQLPPQAAGRNTTVSQTSCLNMVGIKWELFFYTSYIHVYCPRAQRKDKYQCPVTLLTNALKKTTPCVAPLIYLHSEDPYMPSDFATLVTNSIPTINYAPVAGIPSPLTLDNLDSLNSLGGKDIFLTTKEGIRALPEWFRGTRPDKAGKTVDAVTSIIVVRDHGDGKTVDVFYFYYYA